MLALLLRGGPIAVAPSDIVRKENPELFDIALQRLQELNDVGVAVALHCAGGRGRRGLVGCVARSACESQNVKRLSRIKR